MKSFIALCVLMVVAVSVARPDGEQYTDRYDNINLDEILSNKKLSEAYKKCLLDQGKCTPEGKELKDNIGDALATECAKCTDAQKKGIKRVIKHLVNNEPESWEQLKAKYDADNKYATKYEKELREVSA